METRNEVWNDSNVTHIAQGGNLYTVGVKAGDFECELKLAPLTIIYGDSWQARGFETLISSFCHNQAFNNGCPGSELPEIVTNFERFNRGRELSKNEQIFESIDFCNKIDIGNRLVVCRTHSSDYLLAISEWVIRQSEFPDNQICITVFTESGPIVNLLPKFDRLLYNTEHDIECIIQQSWQDYPNITIKQYGQS